MAKKRIVALKSKTGQMRSMGIPLYNETGPLKGLPSKMHVILIMWGYSPEPVSKLRKMIPNRSQLIL
jgi:hypothetical protein